jgi:transcription antitermination protein NusB
MPARHRSRQRALQVLFLWDQSKIPVEGALESFYETLGSEEEPERTPVDPFMEELVRGTVKRAAEIDARITAKSDHWRIDRMPVVDRNILRLAAFEIAEFNTPAPVVIDEALDLARQFSGDESVSFINGVLDAIHRDKPA